VVVGVLDMTQVNYGSIMASALLPAGESLADHLSPELHARTLAAVAPLGLAPAVADRLEVWFLALMLSNDPAEIERQRQGLVVLDDWLQQEGRRQGKAIVGLEALEEQLGIFAGWPETLQVAMLRAALDYPGLIAGSNAALTALWHDARGDWERAHDTAQEIDDETGAWIHAYLHRKEGDDGNAHYWYRRAKQKPASGALDAEWRLIVDALLTPP